MKALSFCFFIRFFDLYCPRCIVALQKMLGGQISVGLSFGASARAFYMAADGLF